MLTIITGAASSIPACTTFNPKNKFNPDSPGVTKRTMYAIQWGRFPGGRFI